MTDERYPAEVLGEDDDDGTMVESLKRFTEAVVGHRIVSVEKGESGGGWIDRDTADAIITLDDGSKVKMVGNSDCCAYTEVSEFLLHPELVDHEILGVGTTDGYTTWHIFADLGDILKLTVGWSCGNPFYYGYGFDIVVEEVNA